MAERRLARGLALALLAGFGCSEPPASLPYGFEAHPRQAYRLEAQDTTEVDGAEVVVQRVAEFEYELP